MAYRRLRRTPGEVLHINVLSEAHREVSHPVIPDLAREETDRAHAEVAYTETDSDAEFAALLKGNT